VGPLHVPGESIKGGESLIKSENIIKFFQRRKRTDKKFNKTTEIEEARFGGTHFGPHY